jgi:hypothetical protein
MGNERKKVSDLLWTSSHRSPPLRFYKRSRPYATLEAFCVQLGGHIVVGVFLIGDCQPELNQTAAQIGVANPTNRDRPPVPVITHSLAVHVPKANLLPQSIRRRDTAFPIGPTRGLAELLRLWRIDPMQTDSRAPDIKSVAIDNSRFAGNDCLVIRGSPGSRYGTNQHHDEEDDGQNQLAQGEP